MKVALTGGTGFLGGHVIAALSDAGHQLRALARRPQVARDGVEWVAGALDDHASLRSLCAGAEAVVHVAGVVNAPDAAGFDKGNRIGTEAMVAAVLAVAPGARFVHVSSLAAREPQLSHYGSSKLAAEQAVVASPLDWRVVRPPAIYGPGDTDNFELFRLAKRGVVPLPPRGRLSLIHADDLAQLIVALAASETGHVSHDADDGRRGGWSHADYARAIGAAVGRRVRTIALPAALVRAAARLDLAVRGANAKLTPDRAAYMCHPDWVIDASRRPPAGLWVPRIDTPVGLAATAAWYRAKGLL